MTANQIAGAVSGVAVDWHAIDWQQVHCNVRRLQARIVKAEQEGKRGKVKALQRLLTHSFSGKALAVKRVTENQGKRTPGVDQAIWDTPAKKSLAVQALKQWGYQPLPLRRVYILKKNGKKRPLGIPTMQDRAMQALYLLALDPIAEVHADPNSYGFRLQRSTADAIGQCFTCLSSKNSAPWILEGDICACFDRISHEWLLAHVPMERAMLQKWLKAGYMEGNALHPTEEGTPQGGILSPVLANLTLDGLERELRQAFPKTTTLGHTQKVNYARYADDFVVTGSSKELLEEEVKPLVEQFMRQRGLELSTEKTRVTHIEDGFDFLGQNVRKYDGKLLIKPSIKNTQDFLAKARGIIEDNKQAPAGKLIEKLNPVIRGWANYHRHVVSKATFQKVDHRIFEKLWRWAKRRHPNKEARWVRDKYFQTVDDRHWVFSGTVERAGRTQRVRLFAAASTPIVRHMKIRSEANPYDPQWEVYFEERLGVKMVNNLRDRRDLLRLWQDQNGICPICGEKITQITGWHDHHILWRSKGGGDGLENRVLLHPNCHRQVHSSGLTVAKPRPARDV